MFTSLHDDYTKWGYVFPPRSCRYWLTAMGAVCAAPILRTRDAGLCFVTSLCKDTNVTNTVFTRQWLLCTGLHLPCLEVDPLIDIMDIIDICRVRQRRGMKRESETERESKTKRCEEVKRRVRPKQCTKFLCWNASRDSWHGGQTETHVWYIPSIAVLEQF